MSDEGMIGFGVQLKLRTATGPDVFTTIGRQAELSPPGTTVDSVDASHTQSPNAFREFIPGMGEVTEATTTLLYNPTSTSYATLKATLRTIQVLRWVWQNGSYWQFSAFITEITPETPLDDKMTCNVTWKCTGEMTSTQASAPSNSVLPAISGTPQVGVVLTAHEGVWDNEPTSFTYAWKNGGVAIGGATARTYTPVVGDVGDTLTVTVTGTNSAGNASATSAGAIAVIAA